MSLKSAEMAAQSFSDEVDGNIYSRYTNPTVRTFEQRLAALEGGEQCVATSSGMAATLSVIMGLLKSGDHIVCSRDVFGSTRVMMDKYITKFGVDVSYVALADLSAWQNAMRPILVCCSVRRPPILLPR